MASRRALLWAAWVGFFADLFVGAGLLLYGDGAASDVGLLMIVAAALVLAGFTLWFYLQNRKRASPP
jgi:hypothetical protein